MKGTVFLGLGRTSCNAHMASVHLPDNLILLEELCARDSAILDQLPLSEHVWPGVVVAFSTKILIALVPPLALSDWLVAQNLPNRDKNFGNEYRSLKSQENLLLISLILMSFQSSLNGRLINTASHESEALFVAQRPFKADLVQVTLRPEP